MGPSREGRWDEEGTNRLTFCQVGVDDLRAEGHNQWRMRPDSAPAAGETIGRRLKRLRLDKGLSQRELAAPGVSYAYISRIEAGTRQPSVKALRRLAAKLGVTTEYLETGSQLGSGEHRELRLADLELAVRLGEGAELTPSLLELATEAIEAGDREIALRARVALATLAQSGGEHLRAALLLEATLAEEDAPTPAERHDIYSELGRAYAAAGQTERAVALFERCLASVVGTADVDPTLEARYATLLSYALCDVGELERAESVVREVLDRTRDSEDPYTRVRLYWSLARVSYSEDKQASALTHARKAISLLETTEDTLNLARAHLLAASIMIARAAAHEAAIHLDHAERLFGRSPAFGDALMLRVKRAQVAALRRDGPTAVRLAREAIELAGDELPEERGAAYVALADGLALQSEHHAACGAYRQAVETFEQHRRRREAVQAREAWARVLERAGRGDEAAGILAAAPDRDAGFAPASTRAER